MLQKSFQVRWKLTCLPCVTHHAKTFMYVISFQTQRLGHIHCKTSTMRVEGQVLDHERERNPFVLYAFPVSSRNHGWGYSIS